MRNQENQTMPRIGLLGAGRMGQAVTAAAARLNLQVVYTKRRAGSQGNPEDVDVFVDFSNSSALAEHLQLAGACGAQIVSGVTGPDFDPESVYRAVGLDIGFVYGANFSIGANIFFQAAELLAQLCDPQGFDVGVLEIHHRHKTDLPSGTSIALAQRLRDAMPSKHRIAANLPNRAVEPDELVISSMRVGEAFGMHEAFFESKHDSIALRHTARSRDGFAEGALRAAQWIMNKRGFFRFEREFLPIVGNSP